MYFNLMSTVYVTLTILIVAPLQCFSQNGRPLVKMTHGQVWPKPVIQNSYNVYLEFEQENFYFNVRGQTYI
jgi:hypothetical protein